MYQLLYIWVKEITLINYVLYFNKFTPNVCLLKEVIIKIIILVLVLL